VNQDLIPVFSGGIGRSGTTIVGTLLRKHPNLFSGAPNEVRFITEVYGLLDLVYGMHRIAPTQLTHFERASLYNPLNRSIQFRYRMFRRKASGYWWKRINRLGEESGIHRAMSWKKWAALLDELEAGLDNPVTAGRNFLFGYMRNHRRYKGQKYWMDTTPPNMMFASEIYRLFPESRFIDMRRNPLDNLASVIPEPWGPNDLKSALPWFKDRMALADAARSKVPSERYLTLWLEDLVLHEREASYSKLLSVVGIDDDENMSKFFNEEVTVEKAHIGRWRKGFANPEQVRSDFLKNVGPIERET
jgi:hypothetical protein